MKKKMTEKELLAEIKKEDNNFKKAYSRASKLREEYEDRFKIDFLKKKLVGKCFLVNDTRAEEYRYVYEIVENEICYINVYTFDGRTYIHNSSVGFYCSDDFVNVIPFSKFLEKYNGNIDFYKSCMDSAINT